jgi:hypothetical protein
VLRARYYDPSTGEFTSPDPLEYVDGMSLYRGYFVGFANDPLGTISVGWPECRVKDYGLFKHQKDCGIMRHEGQTLYGFSFTGDAEFEEDFNRVPPFSCSCCEYRQYVLEESLSLHVELDTGQSMDLGGTSYTGPGYEDCSDTYGCYGYRSNPFHKHDGYQKDQQSGCTYHMQDSPHLNLDKLKQELDKRDPNFSQLVHKLKIDYRWRFLANIKDVCRGIVVVAEVFQKSCKSTLRKPWNK